MIFHESNRRGVVLLFVALLVCVPFVTCNDNSAHQQQDRVVHVHVTDQELDIVLDAGTYRVYCPVDESHGKPLQLALHVTPAPPATASQS